MKEGHITFKFKSESDYDTVKIPGESIAIKDLKTIIAIQRKLGHDAQKELVIYDSKDNTKGKDDNSSLEYSIETQRISANSIVMVERRLAMPSAAIMMSSKSDTPKCPVCAGEQRLILAAPCCGQKMCGFCKFEFLILGLENGPNCQHCGKSRIRAMKYQVGHSSWNQGSGGNGGNPIPSVNQNEMLKILNESRYFIIKSLNQENIMMAKTNCEWATTLNNQVFLLC